MNTKILFIFLLISNLSFSQIVNIPDANFKQKLIDLGVDVTGDGEIQVGEAEAISFLDLRNANITDLTGIEAFVNLYSLNINNLNAYPDFNNISNVDLSSNVNLEYLYANNAGVESVNVVNCVLLKAIYLQDNNLETLDISNNAELTELYCQNNSLHTLNFLSYSILGTLDCSSNQFTTLDISTQTYLVDFMCHSNNLINLNIHNTVNTYFTNFDATNNPDLNCISVDDENNVPQIIQDGVEAGVSFSNSCNLGTDDILMDKLELYPNPTNAYFHILKNTATTINKIEIFNSLGKQLHDVEESENINISSFSMGIYYIRIYDSKGNHTTKKIVKR